MINVLKLTNEIDKKGLKRTHVAKELGMSVQTLGLKLKGLAEFKPSEIEKLGKILNLKISEIWEEI